MSATAKYLAVDLGASNGRVLLGRWDGETISLEEIHRFKNRPVRVNGHQHWDVLRLWSEIKAGISVYARQSSRSLDGIGVDTWRVDFALLDSQGNLLGNPHHYRDSRTDGMIAFACQKMPREQIFRQTGNQFIQFNTLFQLLSMVRKGAGQLEIADTLLMMPDLFHYWLTGRKATEFTIATTSQMYDIRHKAWAREVISALDIPIDLLPPVVPPGTILDRLHSGLTAETGLQSAPMVVTPASHDTSSAVAAIPGMDNRSVYISCGTWSLMGIEMAEPVINDQVMALNFTNEGGVDNKVNLLRILTGLWLLQESRRQWQRKGIDHGWTELLSMAEQAQPLRSLVDPDAGEFLNPANMLEAINCFCDRTDQPPPDSVGAVVRCCLESLALNYRKMIDDLEVLTTRHLETIRIVGGGSRNRLLSKFTADACQRPVVCGPVEGFILCNAWTEIFNIARSHIIRHPLRCKHGRIDAVRTCGPVGEQFGVKVGKRDCDHIDGGAGQVLEFGRPALQGLCNLRAGESHDIDRHTVILPCQHRCCELRQERGNQTDNDDPNDNLP